jgi:hypothetical protein
MSELLEATRTLERLLTRVAAHVFLEVLRTREPPAAFSTAVRLFTGVTASVHLQVVRRSADFVAGRAPELLHGGVFNLHVPLQVGQSDELPDALIALVRSFASVRPRVGAQVPGLREFPRAQGADVRLFTRVITHVAVQVTQRGEPLKTLVALVRLFALVNLHVRLETARLYEPLGAHLAFVWFVARVLSLVSFEAALVRKCRQTNFATVPLGDATVALCRLFSNVKQVVSRGGSRLRDMAAGHVTFKLLPI